MKYIKLTLKTIVNILFTIIVVIILYTTYYLFLNKIITKMIVKSGFESISGVKVISLSFDDENNFSHVKINVKNKGDIQFIAFRPKYFNNPEHLDIYSIGSCKFNIFNYGFHNYTNTYGPNGPMGKKDFPPYFTSYKAIDIGKKGAFSHFFKVEIKSIKDVISNYNSILKAVKKWPNSKNQIYKNMLDLPDTLSVRKIPYISNIEEYNLEFKYFYTADCQ